MFKVVSKIIVLFFFNKLISSWNWLFTFFCHWMNFVMMRFWSASPEQSRLGIPPGSPAAARVPEASRLGIVGPIFKPSGPSQRFPSSPLSLIGCPLGSLIPPIDSTAPPPALSNGVLLAAAAIMVHSQQKRVWFLPGNKERFGHVVNITGWLTTGTSSLVFRGSSDFMMMFLNKLVM